MKKPTLAAAPALLLLLAVPSPAPAATTLYAVSDERLVSFRAASPERLRGSHRITGLPAGVALRGLDTRPKTGELFALGSDSRLYTLTKRGRASAIGMGPFSTPLAGRAFGFDFNPAVDRIRIVSDSGQNLRAHPDTGALVMADGALNPGSPSVTAAAYTASGISPMAPAGTVLYVIDTRSDDLFIQNPPNDGRLADPQPLRRNFKGDVHFDIVGAANDGLIAGRTGKKWELFRVNIATGKTKKLGRIGNGKLALRGFTGIADG